MKNILGFVLVLSFLVLCSCSSTKSGGQPIQDAETMESNYATLADYLRNNTNVAVNGVEPNIRLQIRGMSSLTSDTRPFFYIDNNPVGRDYARVSNAVNPGNIKRVEVLTNLSQLTRYGQEGHSGIIKIYTNRTN